MTLYSLEALEDLPDADDMLSILADALGSDVPPIGRRVVATPDGRSPDEGLALLDAYVAISDRRVRQAVLDLLITLGGTDPYRRNRSVIAAKPSDPAP